MSEKWDEIETLGQAMDKAIARSEHRTEVANQAKAEKRDINKKIHNAGGEEAVLDQIASGGTVRSLCRVLGVSTSAFYDWVDRGGQTRQDAFARARARGAYSTVDEALEIADSADREDIQVAKLRVETRRWLAGKANPEAFGDKAQEININLGDITLSALRKREIIDVEDVKPVNGADEDA